MEQSDQLIQIGNYVSQFKQRDMLEETGYDSVYVGYQIDNPDKKVVIKLVSLEYHNLTKVARYIEYIQNHHFQGIIKILAAYQIQFGRKKQDHYAIVMEKMDGNLRSLLQKKGNLTEYQAIQWASKIMQCYKHLYEDRIIHINLKLQNVLYRKSCCGICFKITDFSFSSVERASKFMVIKRTIFQCMSPQQAKRQEYSSKTDVYSFGCILLQILVGTQIYLSEVFNSGQINLKEVQRLLCDLEISKDMIQFVQGCLMPEQKDRFTWQDLFNHLIFQKKQVDKQVKPKIQESGKHYHQHKHQHKHKHQHNHQHQVQSQINQVKIAPDTETYAWKQQKYHLDENEKNVCISDSGGQWLCSTDLPLQGDYQFTIKARKIKRVKNRDGSECSVIGVGIMDSDWKQNQREETDNHAVFLSFPDQKINTPNKNHTDSQLIKYQCQSLLSTLPCLISCLVDRQQSLIMWHFNGKKQAWSRMPQSWKDGRKKLCAIVFIGNEGDCVQFM